MKLADAQKKWFWKRCGFMEATVDWQYPDGSRKPHLPPIDLNNLWEYAVPELKRRLNLESIIFSWEDDGSSFVVINYWTQGKDSYMDSFLGLGDTDALAFWCAINRA